MDQWRKTHLIENGRNTHTATRRVRTNRCSGLANWTFQLVCEYMHDIGIAGLDVILHQVQQPHEVGVRAVEHWWTSCKIPHKSQTIFCLRKNRVMNCQDSLEEFTGHLVDEEASASTEAPASISREPLHQEPSIKAVSGKHSIFLVTSRKTGMAKVG